MVYETTRKSLAIRKTSSTSHRHAALRQNLSHGCATVESIPELGGAMVSGLSEERPRRYSESSQMGTALTIDRSSERKAEADTVARSCGNRTRHRSMDLKTYRTTDKGRLWRPVYACRGMEAVTPRFWLELSKAAATCSAKKRKGHCIVEAQDMAHFKKKPESLMPISPFWMKAAFCLYRTSAKPGLPRAAHRSFATATGVIKSRPSAASPYPPAAVVWVFMSV